MAHKIKPAREFILPRRFRVGYRPLRGCLFDHVMRRHRGSDAAERGMPLRPAQSLPTSFLLGGRNLEDVVGRHARADPRQSRMPVDPAMMARLSEDGSARGYAQQSSAGHTGGKNRVAFRQYHTIVHLSRQISRSAPARRVNQKSVAIVRRVPKKTFEQRCFPVENGLPNIIIKYTLLLNKYTIITPLTNPRQRFRMWIP